MDIAEELEEMRRHGAISYSDWADYAWKEELHTQRDRVLQHLEEIASEAETEHNPYHMLERAFSLAAFCMRRLIECRLVTDRFRDAELPIHQIARKAKKWPEGRDPFLSSTGGEVFKNFDMKTRASVSMKPKQIADRFLHARIIAVLEGSVYLPDGLLIASDHQMKRALFHVTSQEFDGLVRGFLDDVIQFQQDWIDTETGEIHALRE